MVLLRRPSASAFLCLFLLQLTFLTLSHSSELYQNLLARQSSNLTECNTIRWRKEIRNLSPAELQQFQDVMKKLVFARDANPQYFPPPSFWDYMVAAHIAFVGEAHDGAYFLPWHRLFLLTIENEIRRTIDEQFTIPYWDWTVDAEDPARSSIFTSTYLGSSLPSRPISDGPFSGLMSIYPRPRPLLRDFNSSNPGDIAERHGIEFASRSDIQRITAMKNWSDFATALEDAHDNVHVGIGGALSDLGYSPNDPLFYMLHAFVDKVWTDRQLSSDKPFEFGGTHRLSKIVFQAKETDVLKLFGRQVRFALRSVCVRYVPYKEDC